MLGGIADRLGRGPTLALIVFALGLTLFWWLAATGFSGLAVFALAFGLFYGGFVALIPAFTADLFGLRAASSVIGVLYTSVAVCTLAGPPLAGWVFDLTGSYAWPIAICAGAALLASVVVLRLPRNQQE